MEKLIKARPIKMVTSFLALLEPGTAAYFCQDLYEVTHEILKQISVVKKKNKGFGIYENSGFKKYYP
ncbi:hypothetical protein RSJ42_17155 [Methanosarcina hadiensis]|uniref:hypothetical protein n=1 Tax=Methanosarcina hadiensis TaxID=3078083 RepID=UPI003977D513